MWGRVGSRWRSLARHCRAAQRGNALVEVALVLPMLLVLVAGVLGVGRVVQAQMGVSAVAREAARAAALAENPAEAASQGVVRGQEVAVGYELTNGSLQIIVDPGSFARGAPMRASAHYEVALDDLPLLGWARVRVGSDHVERIDLYRSRWSAGGQP